MQTYGISMEVIGKEINATQKFLEKYRDTVMLSYAVMKWSKI